MATIGRKQLSPREQATTVARKVDNRVKISNSAERDMFVVTTKMKTSTRKSFRLFDIAVRGRSYVSTNGKLSLWKMELHRLAGKIVIRNEAKRVIDIHTIFNSFGHTRMRYSVGKLRIKTNPVRKIRPIIESAKSLKSGSLAVLERGINKERGPGVSIASVGIKLTWSVTMVISKENSRRKITITKDKITVPGSVKYFAISYTGSRVAFVSMSTIGRMQLSPREQATTVARKVDNRVKISNSAERDMFVVTTKMKTSTRKSFRLFDIAVRGRSYVSTNGKLSLWKMELHRLAGKIVIRNEAKRVIDIHTIFNSFGHTRMRYSVGKLRIKTNPVRKIRPIIESAKSLKSGSLAVLERGINKERGPGVSIASVGIKLTWSVTMVISKENSRRKITITKDKITVPGSVKYFASQRTSVQIGLPVAIETKPQHRTLSSKEGKYHGLPYHIFSTRPVSVIQHVELTRRMRAHFLTSKQYASGSERKGLKRFFYREHPRMRVVAEWDQGILTPIMKWEMSRGKLHPLPTTGRELQPGHTVRLERRRIVYYLVRTLEHSKTMGSARSETRFTQFRVVIKLITKTADQPAMGFITSINDDSKSIFRLQIWRAWSTEVVEGKYGTKLVPRTNPKPRSKTSDSHKLTAFVGFHDNSATELGRRTATSFPSLSTKHRVTPVLYAASERTDVTSTVAYPQPDTLVDTDPRHHMATKHFHVAVLRGEMQICGLYTRGSVSRWVRLSNTPGRHQGDFRRHRLKKTARQAGELEKVYICADMKRATLKRVRFKLAEPDFKIISGHQIKLVLVTVIKMRKYLTMKHLGDTHSLVSGKAVRVLRRTIQRPTSKGAVSISVTTLAAHRVRKVNKILRTVSREYRYYTSRVSRMEETRPFMDKEGGKVLERHTIKSFVSAEVSNNKPTLHLVLTLPVTLKNKSGIRDRAHIKLTTSMRMVSEVTVHLKMRDDSPKVSGFSRLSVMKRSYCLIGVDPTKIGRWELRLRDNTNDAPKIGFVMELKSVMEVQRFRLRLYREVTMDTGFNVRVLPKIMYTSVGDTEIYRGSDSFTEMITYRDTRHTLSIETVGARICSSSFIKLVKGRGDKIAPSSTSCEFKARVKKLVYFVGNGYVQVTGKAPKITLITNLSFALSRLGTTRLSIDHHMLRVTGQGIQPRRIPPLVTLAFHNQGPSSDFESGNQKRLPVKLKISVAQSRGYTEQRPTVTVVRRLPLIPSSREAEGHTRPSSKIILTKNSVSSLVLRKVRPNEIKTVVTTRFVKYDISQVSTDLTASLSITTITKDESIKVRRIQKVNLSRATRVIAQEKTNERIMTIVVKTRKEKGHGIIIQDPKFSVSLHHNIFSISHRQLPRQHTRIHAVELIRMRVTDRDSEPTPRSSVISSNLVQVHHGKKMFTEMIKDMKVMKIVFLIVSGKLNEAAIKDTILTVSGKLNEAAIKDTILTVSGKLNEAAIKDTILTVSGKLNEAAIKDTILTVSGKLNEAAIKDTILTVSGKLNEAAIKDTILTVSGKLNEAAIKDTILTVSGKLNEAAIKDTILTVSGKLNEAAIKDTILTVSGKLNEAAIKDTILTVSGKLNEAAIKDTILTVSGKLNEAAIKDTILTVSGKLNEAAIKDTILTVSGKLNEAAIKDTILTVSGKLNEAAIKDTILTVSGKLNEAAIKDTILTVSGKPPPVTPATHSDSRC
eukprot:sb/3460725/